MYKTPNKKPNTSDGQILGKVTSQPLERWQRKSSKKNQGQGEA